jgi:hypothetical protein
MTEEEREIFISTLRDANLSESGDWALKFSNGMIVKVGWVYSPDIWQVGKKYRVSQLKNLAFKAELTE